MAYSLPSPVKDNPCCTKEDGVYWEMFSVATRDISVHPAIYFSSTTARIAWSTLSPILRGCPKRTRRAVSVRTPVRHSWYAWHHISHLGTLLKWCSSSHEFCKHLWRLQSAVPSHPGAPLTDVSTPTPSPGVPSPGTLEQRIQPVTVQ